MGHRGLKGTQGDTGDSRGHKGTQAKEGTVSKIVVCLCNFYKKVWVKNKDTILFTNHLRQMTEFP